MISDKPWSLQAVVRLFLAIVITSCLGLLMAGAAGQLKLGLSGDQVNALQMLISAIFLQGTALGWITFFLRMHAITWSDAFGLRQSNAVKVAGYGLAIGLLFLPIAWGLQTISDYALQEAGVKPEEQSAVQALQNPNLGLATKAALGVLAVIIAPIAEESLFRGIIYTSLKQQGYRGLAWWGTSTLFAAMHFNAASFAPLLMFSLVLIFLYEAFGNLLVPIMAHVAFNAVNFLILVFQDQLDHLLHLQ